MRAILLSTLFAAAPAQDSAESSVGIPFRIEGIVLPGPELEPAPADPASPIVLRILATWPHGSAFRYDLEATGLEPGEYDLSHFLRRKDGSEGEALPPIPARIRSVLPLGRLRPHPPAQTEAPSFGGYRALLVAGGALWVGGLVAILFVGRRRRREEQGARARPKSLAERLRPLVEAALEGRLSRADRARLELGLVAYWRRRLGLEERRADEVLALLREHEEAGPLLRGLEDWLHRPAPPPDVDVAALLSPYKNLPADAMDAPAAR